MSKKNIILLITFSFILGFIFMSPLCLAGEQATGSAIIPYTVDPVSTLPASTPVPAKDEKTLKAEIKGVKKEIDATRKKSKAVLKEIKALRRDYESMLKKMQNGTSTVTITADSLEKAKEKLVLTEAKNDSIKASTDLVKDYTSTYSSQYRSKNYQGALETYQSINMLEKQILSDYEIVKSYYTEILSFFQS